MNMDRVHQLDKEKLAEELRKRGWVRDRFGSWASPIGHSLEQCDSDWVAAILAAVICPANVPAGAP